MPRRNKKARPGLPCPGATHPTFASWRRAPTSPRFVPTTSTADTCGRSTRCAKRWPIKPNLAEQLAELQKLFDEAQARIAELEEELASARARIAELEAGSSQEPSHLRIGEG